MLLRKIQVLFDIPHPVMTQVLRDEPTGYAADLWALGCLLYHMLVGQPPFKGASEYLTFQLISGGEYAIPGDVPEAAQDLIRQLLLSDPSKRLGGLHHLEHHRRFNVRKTVWTFKDYAGDTAARGACFQSPCLSTGTGDKGLNELKEHRFFDGRLLIHLYGFRVRFDGCKLTTCCNSFTL